MAGETIITVVGNLTADPELRYTQQGKPVANATVASTPRTFDRQANEWKDGEALFLRMSIWGDMGEHAAGSLTKGTRVIVTGRLKQNSYKDKEGNDRTSIELEVDEIAPSLKYATASVTKAQSGGQRGQGGPAGGGNAQQAWAPQGAPQGYPPQGAPQAPPQGYPQQPQQGYPQGYAQGGQPPQAPQQAYQQPPQQPGADVWNTPGTSYQDETPF